MFTAELAAYRARGYQPGTAGINFKVYWRKPDTEVELLMTLPELCVVKGKKLGSSARAAILLVKSTTDNKKCLA